MSDHDEQHERADLDEWANDALVRALRAPGSTDELAREAEYVAAYRDAVRAPTTPTLHPRNVVRKLGAGGTAVVVAIALSGGAAAAAYTGHLPDPVQEIAHSVIGAPAPDRPHGPNPQAKATDPTHRTPPSSPSPDAATSSPAAPAVAPPGPSASPGASAPDPDRDPSTAPSRHPSAEPSSSSPSAVSAAAATITASGHLVGYGNTVTLSGRLTTSSGRPAPGVRVALQVKRTAGGWSVVATSTTDDTGAVSATSLPVTGLARYRWRAVGARSGSWPVRVEATVSAAADVGDDQTTISGTAIGAKAGDAVVLVTRARQRAVVVRRGQVAGDGTVSFTFRTPPKKRAFSLWLLPTPDHSRAKARVVVANPRSPAASPSASPSD
ncbi:MAG: hypothetical protein QM714_18205 [Nocardioides sp.]|uniref:hypothetical protein n=1 Tax=Nocardioides sp. TaxID=35761 RepID=UPI0039E40209